MPAAARADTMTIWNDVADQLHEAAYETPNWRTAKNTRGHAQMALAMFEAVNSIHGSSHSHYGLARAAGDVSAEAAASAAAHAVLIALFPDDKKPLEEALAVALAGIADGAAEDAGVLQGRRAAELVMRRSAVPEGQTLPTYRPLTTVGKYIDPRLPSILPFDVMMPSFFLKDASALRPGPPPALDSATYAADLEEVRLLGAKTSTQRPADKTLLAKSWLNIDYSALIARVANRPGRTLLANTRLYALAWAAIEDSWLSIMDAKMHFATWRPVTAIRNADADGNPATLHDPSWESFLPTPTHPDYPCGHCGVSAAFATIMQSETGPAPEGGVHLSSTQGNRGLQVVLPTWTAFVDEMSMSRIYAGAHTRAANSVAEAMGRETARLILEKFPASSPSPAAAR